MKRTHLAGNIRGSESGRADWLLGRKRKDFAVLPLGPVKLGRAQSIGDNVEFAFIDLEFVEVALKSSELFLENAHFVSGFWIHRFKNYIAKREHTFPRQN